MIRTCVEQTVLRQNIVLDEYLWTKLPWPDKKECSRRVANCRESMIAYVCVLWLYWLSFIHLK